MEQLIQYQVPIQQFCFFDETFNKEFRYNMGNINQSINYFNNLFQDILPNNLGNDELSLEIIKHYNHLLKSIYDSIKFLLTDSKNKKDELLNYYSHYQNIEYNLNIQIAGLNQQIEYLNQEIIKRDQSIMFLEKTIDKNKE